MMLTTLILNNNPEVDDKFCVLLSRLIEGRSPLTRLELDETSVTEQGLKVLVQACYRSTIFESISVRDCSKINLGEFMWNDTAEALTHNCSITKLDLNNINVDPEFQIELDAEIEKNKLIVEHIFPRVHE